MSGYQDSNLIPSRSQSGCDTGPRYRPQTKKGHQMVTSLSGYQDSNLGPPATKAVTPTFSMLRSVS